MEDNETPHHLYKQGFNEGYVIAKHLPAFNVTTVKGLENSERGLGFQHGQKQFLVEKTLHKLPWMEIPQSKEEPDKSKGKDEIDTRE